MAAHKDPTIALLLADLALRAEEYLQGKADAQAVGNAATTVIVHREFESLPDSIQEAVHVIFDVHDGKAASWHPGDKELRNASSVIREFVKL